MKTKMTVTELGEILKSMYEGASYGEAVPHIHLFGVKYADEIKLCGYKVTDIVKASGINSSYSTEVRKGIKLSRYVVAK